MRTGIQAVRSTERIYKILIIDDLPENLQLLLEVLGDADYSISTAINGQMALDSISEIDPDLILLDIMLPDMDGYKVIRQLKKNRSTSDIPVIFISALSDSADKVKAFQAGGVDYISKPFRAEEVLARVNTHISLRRAQLSIEHKNRELEREKADREKTESELSRYQEHLSGLLTGQLLHPKAFNGIVTQCPRMRTLFQYIEALACSSEPVLVVGESGVGKELIARAIHDVCRPAGPWVAVNIAGFDDNVFSDTLFGHLRGAFTDASQGRSGMIEEAAGGTLFLDEIGDLSPASQIKLLRLLQEKDYYPLGSDVAKSADCRIVVATNVDLKQKAADGQFRTDLYYRLTTHKIEIPPLRERKEDIPLLLEHFLAVAAADFNKKKPSYPAELPTLLSNYSYPGNIRELRAMVFDAMSTHKNRMLSMDSFKAHLGPDEVSVSLQSKNGQKIIFTEDLPSLKEASALLVEEALQRTDGNQGMAAKLLGITRSALNIRLKKQRGRKDEQV